MNKLIKNISQIATPIGNSLIKGKAMNDLKVIENGAIYIEDHYIKYVGTTLELLDLIDESMCQVIDAKGKCCLPGFVDSHTHFVFGGYREDEFIKRLKGASYMEIMQMGGGIQASVNATREETFDELYKNAEKRSKNLLKQGVTTVEGKSGYGLDLETELKQLNVMKKLNEMVAIDIVPTYLGAHATPLEYKGRTDDYIDYIIEEILPKIRREELAEYCDVFCEEGVFSLEQAKKLLSAAKEMGFRLKIHADEIINIGASELACQLGTTSADHLLVISEAAIAEMAKSQVVATLLPCTAFCLDKSYAPGRKMIDAGCGVALASDLNPGSCFTSSVPLIIATAAIQMKMTPEEIITSLTLNGAAALDRADSIGSIEIGKKADLVLLEYPDYKFLVYHTATNIVDTVIKEGEIVWKQ